MEGLCDATISALNTVRIKHGISGLVLAIRHGTTYNSVISLGTRGPDSETAIATDSLFPIASVTKTFIAAAILRLVQTKAIRLDANASDYLSDIECVQGTVRQLLNHTSGIANFTNEPYWHKIRRFPNRVWQPTELFSYVGEPWFSPGSDYRYSNTNYIILGLIAERATGQDLHQVLKDQCFTPAGINNTFLNGPDYQNRPLVECDMSTNSFDVLNGIDGRHRIAIATSAWAAGGIVSTANDLLEWIIQLTKGAILDSSSRALMVATGESDYGLGIQRQPVAGHSALGHCGMFPGYYAVAQWIEALDLYLVAMFNQMMTDQQVVKFLDEMVMTIDNSG